MMQLSQKNKGTQQQSLQLMRTILLMRSMKLPTERQVLKSVFEGMFAGGRYEEIFPNGVSEAGFDRFMQRHSDMLETGTKKKH